MFKVSSGNTTEKKEILDVIIVNDMWNVPGEAYKFSEPSGSQNNMTPSAIGDYNPFEWKIENIYGIYIE